MATTAAMASAQTPDAAGIFENPGPKQTHEDFKPAPATIDTNFGTLEFINGAFPDQESTQRIYDEMDLQRATQAYMDFLPAMSVYAIVKSQVRDFGLTSSSDFAVMADLLTADELYLTGNDITVYAVASLDLKADGPTVVEIPQGMMGTANDGVFRYLTDFGAVGLDQGEGGNYLFLPPGYTGAVPDGYFVIRSPSYLIWAMMRGFGEVGKGQEALDWFEQRLKIYPLSTGPRPGRAVNASGMGANTLPPEDGSAFAMLNELIQYEPSELFDPESLGHLATLGIEKGKPFEPDARMQRIFDQAAKQGTAMSRAIVYASRDPDINYWPDRRWEKMFVRNTEFTRNGYNDIDARTLWHYSAIVVSPNLLSTTPGAGTAYLTAFRDSEGRYRSGDRTYRLRVPANPPVERFWAVTLYDPQTRSLLSSPGNITVGSMNDPEVNADGSVDVYFGPEPTGQADRNRVTTDPEKGWFAIFRFYGPLEGYIEKTWTLGDIELVE